MRFRSITKSVRPVSSPGGGAVDPAEHQKLRSAMIQLEKRFREVMNQVAALREERQGLEHLCEQLQGETDTIGKLDVPG